MKVAVISTCYPKKDERNHGVFIHKQLKALCKLGWDCHVFQPVDWFPPFGLHKLHPYWREGFKQSKRLFSEFEGIKIHQPRIFKKMPARFFHDEPWEAYGKAIGHYISKHKKTLGEFDIIYSHFLCYEGYAGLFTKEILNKPLAAIARGDDVHAWPEAQPFLSGYISKVLMNGDLVLANSSRLASDTKKFLPTGKNREVFTVYNGIELNKFSPVKSDSDKVERKSKFGFERDKKYLLCVATAVETKGWKELMDALELVKPILNGWKLAMVYPPRNYSDFWDPVEHAETRGLSNYIHNIGLVDPFDMPQLYQACDAFILPSHNEGMANAVLEALASGLPTIATDVGGHSEVITNMEDGILVEPKNHEALADAITQLLTDQSVFSTLKENARSAAVKVGSYEDNAKKLIALFQKVIDQA